MVVALKHCIFDHIWTFLDHFWTTVQPKKIFFSDFDKIWRGNSQKYGDSKYQKKFQNFHFSDHFLTVCANAQFNAKNFCCKIFCLQKISIGANLKGIDMCVKKLVFSSKIEIGGVAVLPPGGRDPQN